MSDREGRPGLEGERPPLGSHTVAAVMGDMESARLLMKELENQGIPPGAIGMEGTLPASDDGHGEDMPESAAFNEVSRSTVGGVLVGMAIGAVLGFLVTIPFSELSAWWGVLFGAVFGGGIGLAVGGMAVAKFNSPAWRESYETTPENGRVEVTVHDADADAVETAERLMRDHGALEVRRPTDDG